MKPSKLSAENCIGPPKIIDKILQRRILAYLAFYLLALFYARYAFDVENMEHTRISEHALMPGLADSNFNAPGTVVHHFKKLENTRRNEEIHDYILNTFRNLSIRCYQQTFKTRAVPELKEGKNLYAFVRSTRADGTGVTVITIKLNKSHKDIIAHVLAFAGYIADQNWLSRDVLFVFVDGKYGMDAFFSEYLKMDNSFVEGSPIQGPTGQIYAAIAYEVTPSSRTSGDDCIITAKINGINGHLPNLDLFNSAVRIADRIHCFVNVYDSINQFPQNPASSYGIMVPLRALYSQAFVVSDGLHSVFGKYGIQGLTLSLSPRMRPEQAVKFIESMTKAQNNALEKLHQSYFMYVLGNATHFASIAFYIPIVILLVVPLVVHAYYEWRQLENFEFPSIFVVLHVFGVFIYFFTNWAFSQTSWKVQTFFGGSEKSDVVSILAIGSIIPLGLILPRVSSRRSLRFLICLECSLVLCCLSLLNFGLATFISIVAVPAIIILFNTYSLHLIATIITNPLVIWALCVYFLNYHFNNNIPSFDLSVIAKTLLRCISEDTLYGSNHLILFTVFAVPIWNLSIASISSELSAESQKLYVEKTISSEEDATSKKNI